MNFARTFAAAALMLGLASAGHTEGLTLKLEGGLGIVSGENVGIYSLGRVAPETSTSPLEYGGGMSGGPRSLNYRAEANWAYTLGNGTRMRIGGILSGIDGTSSEKASLHYLVTASPGGPNSEPPLAEIFVCSFPDPCAAFEGELSRSYHEVMAEVMFGRDGANGATTWIGLQGFSGQLAENASNRAYSLPGPNFPFDRTTLTELDADTKGVLLAVQHESTLKSGMQLVLGAGLGRYEGDATGFSVDPVLPGNAKAVSAAFDGTRAQLSVGVEKPIGKGLTLGATVRADYWTDQPRIGMDWTTPPCSPSLCSPPNGTGNFNIVTDPLLSVSVGLSLTFRM